MIGVDHAEPGARAVDRRWRQTMTIPGRWRHVLAGSVILLLTVTMATPALAQGGAVWAWATVRNATGDSLVSGPLDAGSWNSGGAGIHRVGKGHYQVTFYGAQESGSGADIALVSPMGATPRTCAVVSWERVTSSEVVEVKCQTLAGRPIDSRFVVHWLAASGIGGRLAYGFNWSPTSVGASPDEAYNSNGGPITVQPVNQRAQLRFGSQGIDGGVAIVSATDRDRVVDGSFPTSCSLAGLTTVLDPHRMQDPNDDTLDKYADVTCWETDGADNISHEHVVVFMKNLGLKGVVRRNVATLVARRPTTGTYEPSPSESYSSSGGPITVRRLGAGRYEVTFTGMPAGGGAQVTAFNGAERRVCTIAAITTASTPPRVGVSCFDGSGAPRDTRFTLAYTR
jgi:hypothetical protein